MTALVSLLFITVISIDCKITNFPYTCLFTFFGNSYNIGELTSATSKKKKQGDVVLLLKTRYHAALLGLITHA